MAILAWLAAVAALAFVLWALAAFVLRFGHTARLVLTLSGPALLVGRWMWSDHLSRRIPGVDNWDLVFAVLSICAGAMTAVAVIPIWFLAEEKLGWRAPNA